MVEYLSFAFGDLENGSILLLTTSFRVLMVSSYFVILQIKTNSGLLFSKRHTLSNFVFTYCIFLISIVSHITATFLLQAVRWLWEFREGLHDRRLNRFYWRCAWKISFTWTAIRWNTIPEDLLRRASRCAWKPSNYQLLHYCKFYFYGHGLCMAVVTFSKNCNRNLVIVLTIWFSTVFALLEIITSTQFYMIIALLASNQSVKVHHWADHFNTFVIG